MSPVEVGLRVDVDTFRGTRDGVPALLHALSARGLKATFFFCVGPDHMGRHLWRLVRPAFLFKMLRTRAASLYGWDILLCGAFGPGPNIGRLGTVFRAAAEAGHEIGLHAWNHQSWQARVDRWPRAKVRNELLRGYEALQRWTGSTPTCSAVPGWRCTDDALLEKEPLAFAFNSDCRGTSVFRPVVGRRTLETPQVPVTLPTYDEAVGWEGMTAERFYPMIEERVRPNALNVFTIHAEVEGGPALSLFTRFLDRAMARGVRFMPMGKLSALRGPHPEGRMAARAFPGREGWLAVQEGNRDREAVARHG